MTAKFIYDRRYMTAKINKVSEQTTTKTENNLALSSLRQKKNSKEIEQKSSEVFHEVDRIPVILLLN